MEVLQDAGVWRAGHEVLPLGAVLLPDARRDGDPAVRRVFSHRHVGCLVVGLQRGCRHLQLPLPLCAGHVFILEAAPSTTTWYRDSSRKC